MNLISAFKTAKETPPHIFINLPNEETKEVTLKIERPSQTELARLTIKAQKVIDSDNTTGNINAYCLEWFEAVKEHCVDWQWHTEEKIEFNKENKKLFFDSLIDPSLAQVVVIALQFQQGLEFKKK